MRFLKTAATWFFFVYYYVFMTMKTLANAFRRVMSLFTGAKRPGHISPFKAVHPNVFADVGKD